MGNETNLKQQVRSPRFNFGVTMNEIKAEHEYIIMTRDAYSAVLGHCMLNPNFLRNCSLCLKKNNIKDIYISYLYGHVLDWYEMYQRAPTKQELDCKLTQDHADPKILATYRSYASKSYEVDALNFGIDGLQSDISGWLKALIIIKNKIDTDRHLAAGRYDKIELSSKKMIVELRDASFTKDERINTSDMSAIVDGALVNRKNACTLGHPDFDELVMSGARILPSDPMFNACNISGLTRGSLLQHEHTVLIGPSNAGKTTAMTTIAVSNIAMGKKVLLITCEDPSAKIMLKLMQSFHGVRLEDLRHTGSPQFKALNKSWGEVSMRNLFYYEYMKPGKMFIESILEIIDNAQEKELLSTGKGFDLVIIDYPGVLSSSAFARGREQHLEQEYVYAQCGLSARKHGFHILTPAQTNREGFKNNRESENLLDMDTVAAGFGIARSADNVITINRNLADHDLYRVKFYIAKTRSGANKRLFISETRYDLGRTHGVDYGCVAWETNKIKDFNDEEAVKIALDHKRTKTQEMLQSRSPNAVGYSARSAVGAPPVDKSQIAQPANKWDSQIIIKPNTLLSEGK